LPQRRLNYSVDHSDVLDTILTYVLEMLLQKNVLDALALQ